MLKIFIGGILRNMVASACPCTSVCTVVYVIVYISIIVQGIYKKEIQNFMIITIDPSQIASTLGVCLFAYTVFDNR